MGEIDGAMLCLMMLACSILPFAVDAQTASPSRKKFLQRKKRELPGFQRFVIERYVPLNILNGVVMANGIYFTIDGWSRNAFALGIVAAMATIVSFLVTIFMGSWSIWAEPEKWRSLDGRERRRR